MIYRRSSMKNTSFICHYDVSFRIRVAQIQPIKRAPDHADKPGPTRQRDLDPADQVMYLGVDQGSIRMRPETQRS